jgi:hypothetical protein
VASSVRCDSGRPTDAAIPHDLVDELVQQTVLSSWATVEEDPVEILVIIVIAVLVLGVAVGPLLAMRNPAEADKPTPGADPPSRSGKEPDASESTTESPTPRHTEDQP